jgi:hypothetical protein
MSSPSAVIEGLIDYAKHTRPVRGREDFNVAIIKYAEYALEQARARASADCSLASRVSRPKNDGLIDFKPEPGNAGRSVARGAHLQGPVWREVALAAEIRAHGHGWRTAGRFHPSVRLRAKQERAAPIRR